MCILAPKRWRVHDARQGAYTRTFKTTNLGETMKHKPMKRFPITHVTLTTRTHKGTQARTVAPTDIKGKYDTFHYGGKHNG